MVAQKKQEWQIHTVSEGRPLSWGYSSFTVRVSKTGRGKAAVEQWQLKVERDIYLDGYSIEYVIADLQKHAEGLTDANLNVDTVDDYGSISTKCYVSGWSDDVPEEKLAKAKAFIEQQARQARERVATREAEDKAKLLELAARYPELLEGPK